MLAILVGGATRVREARAILVTGWRAYLDESEPDEDVSFLDRYAHSRGMPSRSAAVHRAVELLRAEELGPAYADAWETWAADDAEPWEGTLGDGLGPG